LYKDKNLKILAGIIDVITWLENINAKSRDGRVVCNHKIREKKMKLNYRARSQDLVNDI
jgi:hypothetical protein